MSILEASVSLLSMGVMQVFVDDKELVLENSTTTGIAHMIADSVHSKMSSYNLYSSSQATG